MQNEVQQLFTAILLSLHVTCAVLHSSMPDTKQASPSVGDALLYTVDLQQPQPSAAQSLHLPLRKLPLVVGGQQNDYACAGMVASPIDDYVSHKVMTSPPGVVGHAFTAAAGSTPVPGADAACRLRTYSAPCAVTVGVMV
jgi:hypothetical protein